MDGDKRRLSGSDAASRQDGYTFDVSGQNTLWEKIALEICSESS